MAKLRSVDAAAGTITLTTNTGDDLVLRIGADSSLMAGSTASTARDLGDRVGAQVMAQYEIESKQVLRFQAGVQAGGKATVTGTLKSVDVTQGTITIATEAGQDVVLKASGTSALTLAELQANVGGKVSADYNPDTRVAGKIEAMGDGLVGGSTSTSPGGGARPPSGGPASTDASGSATVTGALKLVNPIARTITVAVDGGQDLELKVAADTKVVANGAASTILALAANAGSQVTVAYNAETRTALSISTSGRG